MASVTGIFLVDTDRTMCHGVNSAQAPYVVGVELNVLGLKIFYFFSLIFTVVTCDVTVMSVLYLSMYLRLSAHPKSRNIRMIII